MTSDLEKTALHDRHLASGARMVPFAGYEMPVHYAPGIIREHRHTRHHAGLFDVSHMGQIRVDGKNAAELLETLMPIDLVNLPGGRQRYGLLLNDGGGIIDDLMAARFGPESFVLVVNAACKSRDLAHLQDRLGDQLDISMDTGKSLLALQGPDSAAVMERLGQRVSDMGFMHCRNMAFEGISCRVSRSGYTGEDGFEISVDHALAGKLADLVFEDERVMWIGLGARDSLRLEAGLNLYGHEMSETTTPVEAGLLWAISRSRRPGGDRGGGFPGSGRIFEQISQAAKSALVGLVPKGRAPVRNGTVIENVDGTPVGHVTSGGFSPSLEHPICLAQIDTAHSAAGTALNAIVRNRRIPATVTALPFVEHRYYRLRPPGNHAA
ncbi:MAG: glycine cleavage system aminomethyltransferase GcvT [Gammaproteobacteria bacterium]|nr:glycine cleavage system aminomethyltransferase GcvT [Gammaproteobacteria bacterium]